MCNIFSVLFFGSSALCSFRCAITCWCLFPSYVQWIKDIFKANCESERPPVSSCLYILWITGGRGRSVSKKKKKSHLCENAQLGRSRLDTSECKNNAFVFIRLFMFPFFSYRHLKHNRFSMFCRTQSVCRIRSILRWLHCKETMCCVKTLFFYTHLAFGASNTRST